MSVSHPPRICPCCRQSMMVIGRERDEVAVGCPSCGHIERTRQSLAGGGERSTSWGAIKIDAHEKSRSGP